MTSYLGWAGPRHPKLLLIGEAWGEAEASLRQPFVGSSGQELFRMLGEAAPDLWPSEHSRVCGMMKYDLAWVRHREAWLEAAGIALTNTLPFRPAPHSNSLDFVCVTKSELPPSYSLPPLLKGKYLAPQHLPHLENLFQQISDSAPNLVVTAGNTPLWACCHTTGVRSLRGTITTSPHFSIKVLPTIHPAAIMYPDGWWQRPIIISDLIKAFREAEFPEIRRPPRRILINPTLDEALQWLQDTIAGPFPLLACDTETTGGMIDTLGFARSIDDSLVLPFGPHREKVGAHYQLFYPNRDGKDTSSYWSPSEEPLIWRKAFELLQCGKELIFQNGVYDLQYLLRMGCQPHHLSHDPMLAHHALWPEMPKSLGFLGSIYTNEPAWKLMRTRKGDTEKREE